MRATRDLLYRLRWFLILIEGALLISGVALAIASHDVRPALLLAVGLPALVAAAVPVVLLEVFALGFFPIAIHEAGHLLAGYLVGYRFASVHVGNYAVWRDRGAFRLRKTGVFSGFNGLARMYTSSEQPIRARYVAFILGGPLASLVCFICSWAGWNALRQLHPEARSLAFSLLLQATDLLTIYSVARLFFALVPMRRGQRASDALALWECLDQRKARLLALQSNVGEWVAARRRASSWDPEILELLLHESAGTRYEPSARLLLYYYLLDTAQPERALEVLKPAFTSIAAGKPSSEEDAAILVEGSYALAAIASDAAAARELLAEADKLEASRLAAVRLRAVAAIQCCEGDYAAADESIGLADRSLQAEYREKDGTLPDSIEAELSWLRALRANPPVRTDIANATSADGVA